MAFILAHSIVLVANLFLFKEVSTSYCVREAYSYDMLVLAQTWPQTACWVINDKWQYDQCSPCKYVPKTSRSSWTAHGLWPSRRDGQHPYYCDDTKKFDEKLLSGRLISEMNEKWASFNLESNNSAFWKHEWDKHGTCASEIQSANTVPKYFSKTLELLDAYNIGDLLKMSGIVPRSQYSYEIRDIVRAIEGVLGVRVTISCAANEINRTNYLDQIYICFDKSLRLADCQVTTTIECSYGNKVIYPEILKPCSKNIKSYKFNHNFDM